GGCGRRTSSRQRLGAPRSRNMRAPEAPERGTGPGGGSGEGARERASVGVRDLTSTSALHTDYAPGPRGDFRLIVPKADVSCRSARAPPSDPHLPHVPAHHLRRVRGGTEGARPDGGKRGRGRVSTDAQIAVRRGTTERGAPTTERRSRRP